MGVKIAIPAYDVDLRHHHRIPVEDVVLNAYADVGRFIYGRYRHFSDEIKRTWLYVLRWLR